MKKIIALLFFLLSALAVAFIIIYPNLKKPKVIQVKDFNECAAAGYKVLESYPRQCQTPAGVIYTGIITENR